MSKRLAIAKAKSKKLRPLRGHEQKAANSFLRSVVFSYDSRWLLEKEGDARKACVPHFKRPWTNTYMRPEIMDAYIGMFTKETVYNLQARWYIECWVWFKDPNGGAYVEQGQMVSDNGKINDAMPAFERMRDKLKAAGNQSHYLYYEWRAEVYRDQQLFETLGNELDNYITTDFEVIEVSKCS